MQTLITPQPVALPAAQVSGVTKTYGRGDTTVRALDSVDAEFPAGRFTAVMGPSGSGKSTLMHCMAGLDTVDSGQVFLDGTDLTALSEKQRTLLRRSRVGFVFQSFNLIGALTADENIRLPLDLAGERPEQGWFDQLVTTLGIADRLEHTPAELSGGQQQRVAIARALITRPAMVVADEPTGNLDSSASGRVLGFLHDAVHRLGQTVVMVTHDATAAAYADRVVFLADGRVVGDLAAPTAETVLDRMKHLTATSMPQER